ncbi:DUF2264 domain-containing protein [Actinocorallia longicatena]|uniref:DUF2264 domain-containing protein n=1 Tax=Actinocorallia longicatena TaxID=111803 RepID=A0ABP6QM46_9ACTN
MLSPYTGWTREHWEHAADDLLRAVRPRFSADGASVVLPGPPSASGCDGLEGFARTFLLAAFRVAGGGPVAAIGPYLSGLRSGPRTWPAVRDRFQPMVEAASLALGLWMTREHTWDALSAAERSRLRGYLAGALVHEPNDNNWRLFPAAVGGLLGDGEAVRRGLAAIDPWYLGEGWYADGDGRALDHYNAWALHLYPALVGLLSGERSAVHEERLRAFLAGYALLFGADGAPVYWGRSLIYRFAAVAPLFLGALLEATPLSPGQTRRLASGALRHFLERGALDADGVLTPGWHGPYPPAVQEYSGPASPYWAAKAFAGLLLPSGHPVWTAEEEPLADGALALPGAGFVAHRSGGVARLVNHGSHAAGYGELYSRFAYSSATSPTTGDDPADNHFGLLLPDGRMTSRGPFEPLGAGSAGALSWARSAHRPPELPDALIESATVVHDGWELRLHRVTGSRVTGSRFARRQTGWATDLPSSLIPVAGCAAAGSLVAEAGTAHVRGPVQVEAVEGAPEDGLSAALCSLGFRGPPPTVVLEHEGSVTTAVIAGNRLRLEWGRSA